MNKNFKYNPFSGILEDDIEAILVPQFNGSDIINKINNSESLAIEFIGRQGRGKTAHLMFLHKKMEDYPLFLLDEKTEATELLNNKANIIFIDSIHHLSFSDRVKIFKAKKTVIYTTHWSRKMTCLLANKNKHTIRFKGINEKTLYKILNKRLRLASYGDFEKNTISTNEVKELINTFGDNYRAILNHLYEKYQ